MSVDKEKGYEVRTYEIVVKTGLHIGGGDNIVQVGGVDNKVIRGYVRYNGKLYRVPIIPGSSIKGKLRSLLDVKYGIYDNEGKILNNVDEIKEAFSHAGVENPDIYAKAYLKLFGTPGVSKKNEHTSINFEEEIGAGRAIFEDFVPTEKTIKEWQEDDKLVEYAEVKAENTINRKTGAASNPRFTERVIPGSVFKGNIILVFRKRDNEEVRDAMRKLLDEAIEMLNNSSYLGGSGTRGYGRVDFVEVKE